MDFVHGAHVPTYRLWSDGTVAVTWVISTRCLGEGVPLRMSTLRPVADRILPRRRLGSRVGLSVTVGPFLNG
jgi:hypothetical protein